MGNCEICSGPQINEAITRVRMLIKIKHTIRNTSHSY